MLQFKKKSDDIYTLSERTQMHKDPLGCIKANQRRQYILLCTWLMSVLNAYEVCPKRTKKTAHTGAYFARLHAD